MPFFVHERKLPIKMDCATDLDPELRLSVTRICDLPMKWVSPASSTSLVDWNDVSLLLFVARLASRFHSVERA